MSYYTAKTRKTTNHTVHLVAGFLTCGLWWFTGWPICALLNRRARTVTTAYPSAYDHLVQPPAYLPRSPYPQPQSQSQPLLPGPTYYQSGYHSPYAPLPSQRAGAPGNEWRQS